MDSNLLQEREDRRVQQNKQKQRMLMMAILMCIIGLVTTYALILPAITMQGDVWCGKEGHLHEEECYQQSLICTVPEDIEGHVHVDECYEQTLICNIEDHEHVDACYEEPASEEPPQESVAIEVDPETTVTPETTIEPETTEPEPIVKETKSFALQRQSNAKMELNAYMTSVAAGPVAEEDQFLFSNITIHFALQGSSAAGKTLICELPKEISLVSSLIDTEQTVTGAGGATAYTCEFVEETDGTQAIEITFDEAYLDGIGDSLIKTNFQFRAKLKQEYADDGNVLHVPFSDEIVVEIPLNVNSKTTQVPAGSYGNYHLSYNEEKDAFTKNEAYAKYYNEDSPLGVAGSFHIVAFDTATLSTHTNGNVLAHTLRANSNFGTNNYANELSYVVNYQKLNSTSASMNGHILVVGSENDIAIGGNKDIIYINDVKIDKPNYIVQDVNSGKTPFIDLTSVNVEVAGISSRLAGAVDQGVTTDFADQNRRSINLDNPSSVGFYSIKASELNNYSNNPMRLTGFTKNGDGALIINVDCTGVDTINLPPATIFIDGQEQSTNEVTEFSNGKVIWNFVNATGKTINTNRMTGMVIALGATVNINQNLNGTVIAEFVNVKAESHRTDFTGQIELLASGVGDIAIRKVDSNNIQKYLEGAEFKLEKWDGKAYVVLSEGLVTDEDGLLALSGLDYNTAYRLTETKAPAGYQLREKPYTFYIPHSDTRSYPEVKPAEFTGSAHKAQYIKNIKNEKAEVVSITIEKEWYVGETKATWIDGLVHVDICQKVFSDSQRTKEIAELSNRIYAESVEIDSHNGWKIRVDNLPEYATEIVNGTKQKVYYSYYVKELPVRGFTPSYENNDGIISGKILISNHSENLEKPVLTEIRLEKQWFDFDEKPMEAPKYSSVTVQLYQSAYEDPLFHHQYGDTIAYGEPIELHALNGWNYTASELPAYALITTEDGPQVIYYAYTAKEKNPGGFSDTYDNNHTYEGTITVKNTQKDHPTELIVWKYWKDENGNSINPDGSITVDVYQKIYGYIDEQTYDEQDYHGARVYLEDVKIRSEDGWKGSVRNLPLHGWMFIDGQRTRVSYTYYIQEKQVHGYKSTYENNQGITEGTITVTNRVYSSYSLPETGGNGTNHFVILGLFLMTLSLIRYLSIRYIEIKKKG